MVALLDLAQLLLVFLLQCGDSSGVALLVLQLVIFAIFLELVHGLLEKLLLLFTILLVGVLLLLEEVELALPEGLVLLELGLKV